MENYVVSARKYRPIRFDDVIGQSSLTTTLRNAIATGKLAHAYLFCGPRGVGKTTCARIFAKTINCLSPTATGEACGTCESCLAFQEQRSYNIHELDAASNNSVEDVRSLIEQVRIQPQVGKYKVFIIDEVHMLSASAFNAFLKTLEEPPAHAIFVLATTEKHKILPTILSRCQIYDFNRMEIPDIVTHLKGVAQKEGYAFEEEALNIIAQKADGGMRDALSIFDQVAGYSEGNITYKKVIEDLNVLDYEYYFSITDQLINKNIPGVMLTLNEILSKGFDANHFMGGLASHFRDLLMSKDRQTLPLLEVAESVRQRYHEQATKCPLPFIYRALKLCNDCDINYKTSRNKRLLVEITLIEVAQAAGNEEPSSGLCPTKKLQPIFNWATQSTNVAQTAPKPSVATTTQPASPTPTVAPKPTPGNTPAGETVARTNGMGIPQMISIRTQNVVKAVNHPAENTPATPTNADIGCKDFDEKELHYHWFRYAMSLPKESSAIAGRMKNMKPELKQNYKIEVPVSNAQVIEYMETLREHLLQTLQKELNNKLITLEFKVTEEDTPVSRHLSPRERLVAMAQKNQALAILQKKLHLELY